LDQNVVRREHRAVVRRHVVAVQTELQRPRCDVWLPVRPDCLSVEIGLTVAAPERNFARIAAAFGLFVLGGVRRRGPVAAWETSDRLLDDVDVPVTPTLTRPAPRNGELGADPATAFDEYSDWLSFAYPFGCTGQPSISLPLGLSSDGLPIGIQLVGPPRGDATILNLAAQLEEALPWRDRHPAQYRD
jgi:Asp-tRNA(Asn)/Glu-tRNA(Gln) amidotransferase A subunit family amidase